MLMQRCNTPLLLAATRCAIDLAEIRGWSAATVTGVVYGLKAVLGGDTGEDLVLLSEVRERVRPRRHSSATRIAEVLAELGLLHDDTTAAIRAWIDRRTGELPPGFGRDVRAWLVVLPGGDAHTRPRSQATLRVHFGIVRSFIECWAATCGHLREITSGDVDTILEPLRGHRRYNAIMALRSLFRFAKRHGLTFADPTRHLRGGRGAERTVLPLYHPADAGARRYHPGHDRRPRTAARALIRWSPPDCRSEGRPGECVQAAGMLEAKKGLVRASIFPLRVVDSLAKRLTVTCTTAFRSPATIGVTMSKPGTVGGGAWLT